MKRTFDLFIALLILIPTAPIMAAIALCIRQQDRAPIFYVAERMKTPEQPFNLIKFRTMSNVATDQNAGVTGGDKADRLSLIHI